MGEGLLRRAGIVAGAVAAAALVVGCSQPGPPGAANASRVGPGTRAASGHVAAGKGARAATTGRGGGSAGGTGAGRAFNASDVRYVQLMIACDQQVLAMADLPQVKDSPGVVQELALGAKDELPAVLAQYRKWLATWKEPSPSAPGTGNLGTFNGQQFTAAFMALFLANQKSVLAAATQEATAGSFGPARQDAANAVAVTTQTIGSIPPG